MRFLVIENEPVLKELYGLIIKYRYENATIDYATNVPEALSKIFANDYLVIIASFEMPAMNGVSFQKILGENWPFIANRVVFISDTIDIAYGSYIKKEGSFFLSKPFINKVFYELVDHILDTEAEKVSGECVRKYGRTETRVDCKLATIDSASGTCDFPVFINAMTTDHSQGGLGLEYACEGLQSGLKVYASVEYLRITNKQANVVWVKRTGGSAFRAGLQWNVA